MSALYPDRGPVRFKRHDRLQLEVKTELLLPAVHSDKAGWVVDLWFVMPQASGIAPGDYPPDEFYSDVRSFLRLKTPHVPLDQLCRADGAGSPLAALRAVRFRASPSSIRRSDHDLVISETKLLSAILKSELRDWHDALPDDPAGLIGAGRDLAGHLEQLVTDWSELREELLPLSDSEVRNALNFSDESLSLQVQSSALALLDLLPEGPGSKKVRGRLTDLAVGQEQWRRDRGWRTVIDEGTEADYLDQSRLLKKYVSSALYLHLDRSRLDGIARHGALGLAAGLAMAWAVAVQIAMILALDLQLQRGVSTSFLVSFSILAVLAYILKDRIKAMLGSFLAGRIPEMLDDRRHELRIPGGEKPTTWLSERMQFVDASELPADVAALRDRSLRNKLLLEATQDILHYKRAVSMKPNLAARTFPRIDGLTDVLRLHVGRWVKTLAATRKAVGYIDEEGEPQRRKLANNYYVDVFVRFERTVPDTEVRVGQLRLVLDRRGLVAVEEAESAVAPAESAVFHQASAS